MKSSAQDADKFFLILTIVFGSFVRLYPLFNAKFPLADGGMFYSMIRDLQNAKYSLPVFTTYNHQQIFFAYPPLALFFTGMINTVTGIPLLRLIQWQPAVINLLTLVPVYLFSARFTRSSTKGFLATLIFSLMPNAYWWQIVGGGLTRSFGAFFAFLFSYFAYRLYHDRDESLPCYIGTALSGALVVLSHPEWALQAAFSGLLFFLLWGRNSHSVRKSAMIMASIIALTAFWWIPVIQRFGIQAFLYAGSATNDRLLFFVPLINLQFTGEQTAFIAVFSLIGALIAVTRKEYFLLIWVAGCLLVDPRGGIPFSQLPLSILAMLSITDLISPFLLKSARVENDPWWRFLDLPVGKLFFGFFAIFCISNAFTISQAVAAEHLDPEEQQAMRWVQVNSAEDAQFLVLGPQANPAHSSLTEWFPALAELHSLTTIQGQEWLGNFHQAIDTFSLYQRCYSEDLICIQEVNKKTGFQEDCIFFSFEKSSQKPENNSLFLSLLQSPQYNRVLSSSKVNIFCLKE